jgi:histidine kinase
MIHIFRQHLSAKLFLSYLLVVLVGVVVLASSAELVIPSAFSRHLSEMSSMMSGIPSGSAGQLEQDLYSSFRAGVTEALSLAALSATLVAVAASLLISRQVVAPVRRMLFASQRIAEGHYEERVPVTGDFEQGDPDELGQLALSFNRMAAKLGQIEGMRRQLIGDVTHELRTPLTTIKGSMEGLMDGVLPPNDETYQQIYQEADRLQRLVNDLQELSQVEAKAYELRLRPSSAVHLIEMAVAPLKWQYEEKEVLVEVEASRELPGVQVDEDRIVQVLINLLGNALQSTSSGGKVSIAAFLKDNEIQISIQDTGIGIAPEHLPHLFTRFYRADKSRSRSGGGSGIGLTLSKHLVEAHGGRIWATSPGLGKGSTFTFTLPVD